MRQSGACVSSTFPPLGIVFWSFHPRQQLTAVIVSPNHLLNPSTSSPLTGACVPATAGTHTVLISRLNWANLNLATSIHSDFRCSDILFQQRKCVLNGTFEPERQYTVNKSTTLNTSTSIPESSHCVLVHIFILLLGFANEYDYCDLDCFQFLSFRNLASPVGARYV